ncbi:MAG: hypothetical protein C0485_11965 [Pirellula sp.]|nr:hypothetical protein [Pirellula sp.]
MAFRATLVGNGVDQTNGTGIWIQRNGVLALVARTGDQAPGLTVGVKFGGLAFDSSNDYFEPEINAAGKIAFRAILAGDGISDENDMSIWSESSGVVTMFIREGDQAPGLPDGVVFSSFDPPVLNASGQMVFRGFITGDEINSSNDIGIWAQDLTGELRLIARAGDLLEVSPGEFVQIGHPAFANQSSEQSGASGFNDRGQLAVYAGGIGFISNRVAVPEPRTEIHTAIALVLVGCVMRSRPTRALGVRGGARFGGAPGR